MKALFRKRAQAARDRRASKGSINDVLKARAIEDSALFIEPHLSGALLMRKVLEIRDYAFADIPQDGLLLELGVYKGEGINHFADQLTARRDSRTIHGFDAFQGLSEDWFGKALRTHKAFDLKGKPPEVRANVSLEVGWVEDTLEPFLARHAGPVAFAHIDTDTYSPCRYALERLADRFVPGSRVLFDEHHGYPNWRNGEFRALNETISPDRYIYRAFAPQQALIQFVA